MRRGRARTPREALGELARTQQEIERSVETFRTLAEASATPTVVHRDDLVLWFNTAFSRLLGSDASEDPRAGRVSSWLETVEGDPSGAPSESATDEPVSALLRTRRGAVVPVEVRRYRILFGGAEATLSMLCDLAAREQSARARAQHERLASLGRLAANLGHEINNPLSYVVSNLGYLRSHLADLRVRAEAAGGDPLAKGLAEGIDEALSAAADALEGAERVAAIVRDVRVLSRIESRALTSVRIPGVIDSAVRIVRGKLAEVAHVSIDVDDVPSVEANDTALLQVFVNLLVNAADACSEAPGSQHEVRVRGFTDADGRAVVEIRDTGPGISDQIREHLFEPFFTTKASGSGFGLAISFAIVEGFGGMLTLESGGSRGAIARVVLPAAVRSPAGQRSRRGSSARRVRIGGRAAPGPAPRARSAPTPPSRRVPRG
ncbi:MAG: hypothetical protein IT386_14115 [Deltaproteobacteria bacterium]|nr:hypothetical protein [Deltaproteobacteria bacterium]